MPRPSTFSTQRSAPLSAQQLCGDVRPIGVDLFAGAGGLSLGFEQAGFRVAAAVEIDPIHCATHERNFPHCAVICASVVELSGAQIRHRAALADQEIDVVFGGAPCQGFSMIGKRALDDPRNQLVFHFVRLVRELKPKYVVFENVKGLTLGKHAQFLSELIEALQAAQYNVTLPYQVLNAADFGVPQDRKRLFLLGTRNGIAPATYPQTANTEATSRPKVWDAIGDLPDADQYASLVDSDVTVAKWVTTAQYARRLRGLEGDPTDFGEPRRFALDQLTSSLRTEHTALSQARFAATAQGATEAISRFRKLPADGLCNTLRAGTDSARGAFTSPRPIHPFLPRVITEREAARLHSYPDWFRFHITKWHGFRQIGNSVPPLLGRVVAQEIAKALHYQPLKRQQVIEPGGDYLLGFGMADAALYFGVPQNTIAQRIRTPAPHVETIELLRTSPPSQPRSAQQPFWMQAHV